MLGRYDKRDRQTGANRIFGRVLFVVAACHLMVLTPGGQADPQSSVRLRPGHDPAQLSWSRWRGPEGTGISRESDWDPLCLEGGPEILWKRDIGDGFSSVSVSGRYKASLMPDRYSKTARQPASRISHAYNLCSRYPAHAQ